MHHMFLERLATFHRRPLIVHCPQEQILDDAAAKEARSLSSTSAVTHATILWA